MNILFIAPVSNYEAKDSGYGNSAAGIAEVLNNMKIKGKIDNIYIVNTLDFERSYAKVPDIEFDISILVANPNSLLQPRVSQAIKRINKKVKKKFLNILWETLPLPRKWDFIWSSDDFDGFVISSYFIAYQVTRYTTKPVYYYPLYIKISEFEPVNIEKKLEEDFFSVLYVGQNTERKGLKDVITTYSRAFNDTDDTQLILKCYNLSDVEFRAEELIKKTAQSNMSCKNSPIYIAEDNLTKDQMNDLYKSSSVLLFLSRGEGFGLPAVEAMSIGIPTVYTDWSALAETANSPENYPISYVLDEAVGMYHHGYEIGSVYAIPSISHSITALRKCYVKWKQNKEKYYTDQKVNREIVKEKYGYETVEKCLLHIIKNEEGFAPEDVFDEKLWLQQEDQWKRIVNKEN